MMMMKHIRIATVLASLTLVSPALAFAQASHTAATKAKPARAERTSDVKGIVKSSDTGMLVITKGGPKGAEETFVLNDATKRSGDLVAGANVDVRYRLEDGKKVATVVTVRSKKSSHRGHVSGR